jgi:hypothetical protein
MVYFNYKEVTSNCFKETIKDLTDALTLYEQKQNVLCEQKVADVIYRVTSVLQLINLEKEAKSS